MDISSKFSAKRIKLFGIVQGVGFRPHVYKIAKQYELLGTVSNSTSGVEIIVEGLEYKIDQFVKDLSNETPPISRIDKVLINIIKPVGFNNFSIVESKINRDNDVIISPDVSICIDCLNEITDPKNRRYRYPFTNCTNCGPRYTIISDTPYDRDKTSMSKFRMCPLCQSEYDDPTNRRFHAQPNACSICGPNIWLTDCKGTIIKSKDPIVTASNFIKKGFVVGMKSLGGFHLVVDATNEAAVKQLRSKKQRKDKPLAIMSANIESICSYAIVEPNERKLLTSPQRPIVLLKKLKNLLIPNIISPNNKYIGVMLPYTPIHYLFFVEGFLALVMTSGNLTGEPISICNEDAINQLGHVVDFFLMHNRDILTRSDDSILHQYGDKSRIIRRSRGYVPIHVNLLDSSPSVLACGAETKNTICLTRKKSAFISQHIGGLHSNSSYNFFQDTIDNMQRILKISPEIIACDYHPDYMSTRYATSLIESYQVVKVQHHHAHIVSCMVENQINDPVIGLAFDGTGIGIDETIWGGEVLITEYGSFHRVNHLELVHMPGGTMAIKEPWRMGISYLYRAFDESFLNLDIPFLNSINERDIKVLITMIREKINVPYTSSLGRLFDGVASIIGLRNVVTFEGQASMELEMIAIDNVASQYNFDICCEMSLITSTIIKDIVIDIQKCVPVGIISAKFHNTIISMFTEICMILRLNHGIKRVVLSGGVFQNVLLMCGIKNNLERNGFEVFTHRFVPFNDGGVSLGQAVIASNLV